MTLRKIRRNSFIRRPRIMVRVPDLLVFDVRLSTHTSNVSTIFEDYLNGYLKVRLC